MWFQVPENDQRLYKCYDVGTFFIQVMDISISRVRVFVFKSLKKNVKNGKMWYTGLSLLSLTVVPRRKIRTNWFQNAPVDLN